MSELRHAALGYAHQGWRVFPLHGIVNGSCTCGRADCSSPGKHPLVRRGLHEATNDPRQIQSWWRKWRSANVGIATGKRSGIVVIDIDLGNRTNTSFGSSGEDVPLQTQDVWSSLDRLVHKLPSTLSGLTGGGGLHLLYRARLKPPSVGPSAATSDGGNLKSTRHQDLRSTCSRLPGIDGELPGIDLRADGGYIVAPPSMHASGNRYSWLDPSRAIADAPEWLEEPPRHCAPGAPQSPPRFSEGEGTAYGLAALDGALTALRCAPIGQRNHTLNREAFSMAQLVAGGELLESEARSALAAVAAGIGLSSHETCVTIESAFDAGASHPRVAPHRLRGR